MELNANALLGWLRDFGPRFGWRRVFTTQSLQDHADSGGVAIIVANNKNYLRAGHICAVVPQTTQHTPIYQGASVSTPVMSQAGSRNHKYFARKWWTASHLSQFGFFVCD